MFAVSIWGSRILRNSACVAAPTRHDAVLVSAGRACWSLSQVWPCLCMCPLLYSMTAMSAAAIVGTTAMQGASPSSMYYCRGCSRDISCMHARISGIMWAPGASIVVFCVTHAVHTWHASNEQSMHVVGRQHEYLSYAQTYLCCVTVLCIKVCMHGCEGCGSLY